MSEYRFTIVGKDSTKRMFRSIKVGLIRHKSGLRRGRILTNVDTADIG